MLVALTVVVWLERLLSELNCAPRRSQSPIYFFLCRWVGVGSRIKKRRQPGTVYYSVHLTILCSL